MRSIDNFIDYYIKLLNIKAKDHAQLIYLHKRIGLQLLAKIIRAMQTKWLGHTIPESLTREKIKALATDRNV